MTNILIERARKQGRNYITPEDVQEEINLCVYGKGKVDHERIDSIRLATLEVLGGKAGAENRTLCAFLAAKGTPE